MDDAFSLVREPWLMTIGSTLHAGLSQYKQGDAAWFGTMPRAKSKVRDNE